MDIQALAVKILGNRMMQQLNEAGLTVVPTLIMDTLQNCNTDTLILLPGNPLIISPATSGEIERIASNYKCMD